MHRCQPAPDRGYGAWEQRHVQLRAQRYLDSPAAQPSVNRMHLMFQTYLHRIEALVL